MVEKGCCLGVDDEREGDRRRIDQADHGRRKHPLPVNCILGTREAETALAAGGQVLHELFGWMYRPAQI